MARRYDGSTSIDVVPPSPTSSYIEHGVLSEGHAHVSHACHTRPVVSVVCACVVRVWPHVRQRASHDTVARSTQDAVVVVAEVARRSHSPRANGRCRFAGSLFFVLGFLSTSLVDCSFNWVVFTGRLF